MDSDLKKKYPWIYQRHWRKPMSHPGGTIAHDGDCGIYRLFRICTCGLHHELMCIPDEAEQIYSKYWDEQDGMYKIDMLMNIEYHEGGLWTQCNKCKGKGGIGEIKCEACEGKGLVIFKMPDPPSEEEQERRMKMIYDIFNENKENKDFICTIAGEETKLTREQAIDSLSKGEIIYLPTVNYDGGDGLWKHFGFDEVEIFNTNDDGVMCCVKNDRGWFLGHIASGDRDREDEGSSYSYGQTVPNEPFETLEQLEQALNRTDN